MKHQIKARYPAKAEVVIRMLTDPAYYPAKFKAMNQPKFEVLSQRAEGDNFSIKLKRQVPLQTPVPGMLKKLLPSETTLVHEDSWNAASRSGRMSVEVPGIPVDLSCKTSLRDDGAGSVLVYDWDIRARIPLIGGVLEKFLAADMEKTWAKDNEVGVALLRNYQ